MIPARVRKEFSSSGKLAKAGWFSPSPLSGRQSRGAWVLRPWALHLLLLPLVRELVRSTQAYPDWVDPLCLQSVCKLAPRRARKPPEASRDLSLHAVAVLLPKGDVGLGDTQHLPAQHILL